MLWLKIGAGIVAAVVLYVLIAGNLAPRTHVASVRLALKRPAAEIFAAISDHAGQKAWRPDLKEVELLPAQEGKAVYRETTSSGAVRYIVDESVADRRCVTRILDENLGYRGRWIFELEPTGGGTRLTITEEGEVTNLMFRALSPLFSKTKTIEGYLDALSRRFGEDAKPEIVRSS
jgi:hypothetical protein